MTIRFTKMHGAGNDFVMIDDRAGTFPADDRRRMAAMGARQTGVGCEGIILVQRSERLDFRMKFYSEKVFNRVNYSIGQINDPRCVGTT